MDKKEKNQKTIERIQAIKQDLGPELIILTHHYQRREIVELGDWCGDSFGLSRQAASDKNARYIVFCGVHFMAESAAILAGPDQTVQMPDTNAGCWMADMADAYLVEKAWYDVTDITGPEAVTPIVYMNSDAMIKAHCGRNQGVICTSSNASQAFSWAFDQREKIFFFPDEHLGRNTVNRLGIPKDAMIVWDPEKPLGGNTEAMVRRASVILWKGHCLVHTRFTADEMKTARRTYPESLIVVHPECTEDVLSLADAVGSTSFIVNYVNEAPPGSTVIVATEVNLVNRLAHEFPDRTVLPLKESLCPNMYKINLDNLLYVLETVGKTNIVTVAESIRKDAVLALDRMLALPGA